MQLIYSLGEAAKLGNLYFLNVYLCGDEESQEKNGRAHFNAPSKEPAIFIFAQFHFFSAIDIQST